MKILMIMMMLSVVAFGAVNRAEKAYYKGVNHFKDLKYEEAIPLFKRAYRLNKGNKDAIYRLALSYQKLGEHGQAIANFTKLKRIKGYEFVTFEMAKSYYSMKKYLLAHKSFNYCIKKKIRIDESYFLKGYMDYKRGKKILSVKSLKKVKKEHSMRQAATYYAGLSAFDAVILKERARGKKLGKKKVKKRSVKKLKAIYKTPKSFFEEAVKINKGNPIGKKASQQLVAINRIVNPVSKKVRKRSNFNFSLKVAHEYDDNVLNENDVDNTQATTKSANKGSANLTAGYKLIDDSIWLLKAGTSLDTGKFYSSDPDIYTSNSASAALNMNSSYKTKLGSKTTKAKLDYAYTYSLGDADKDKKLEFSNQSHVVTPAFAYQFWGTNNTTLKFPVTFTFNPEATESSNSMSNKIGVSQDIKFAKFNGSVSLEYDNYNSKTNSSDKKTRKVSLNFSHPIWFMLNPSFTFSYSVSDYATTGKVDDKSINSSVSVSKNIKPFKIGTKVSYDKSTGNSVYSKYKFGIDLTWTM